MVQLSEKQWEQLGNDFRTMKVSIRNYTFGNNDVCLDKRKGKLFATINDELIQLAGDLDEKCSVKGNIFYITDNNDNCIKDIYTLKDFSIKYIDHVNKLIYDNTNNFSVLKQNICNVFN
tara:strand:- start:143 stop:499 length:357 start_codon:yes stop_codon:yes gene_type:complete